ncbi:MAG: protocatechuate 3,4-dioxygenase [Paracoccaceae bacterium]|nr:protocatechuate 3,4-dioxygenase [Paracoccaceae bacterium]
MTQSRITRRSLIHGGIASTAAVGAAGRASAAITPPQSEGPFYPVTPQDDLDADLTKFGGRAGVAKGRIIYVGGRVTAPDGSPIADAVVDVWQANAHGRYAHEKDQSPAPLDPNFQGWAVLKSDADGGYRFRTVLPGAYAVDGTWTRPPHIHFKVSRRGYAEITTQMYFPDEPLNGADRLLNQVAENDRARLVAAAESFTSDPDTDTLYRFNVVLAPV